MATRALTPTDPLGAILAALPGLSRHVIAHLATRLIERLDDIDGDADLEPNGDAEPIDEREQEWPGDDAGGSHGMDQREITTPHLRLWREE